MWSNRPVIPALLTAMSDICGVPLERTPRSGQSFLAENTRRVLSHFPQRRYLPLRVRLFIDHLKNTYGNPAYWLTS